MTVCIAAMCEGGKKIVAASDHMLSMGRFSADGLAMKDDAVHHNWFAMWSNDVSYVPAILDCVGKQLKREEEYDWMAISTAFQNAHAAVLRSEINSGILARHNYAIDSFYKRGKDELGPTAFSKLHREILEFSLNADFLIYGFDEEGEGHIFTFEGGITKSCDKAGMWAIGSGDYGALSTLFYFAKQNRFNQNWDYPVALYAVLAAKFMAESAEGVGEDTFVTVNEFNHLSGYVEEKFLAKFRKNWFRRHAPKWPLSAMHELEEHYKNYKPGKKQTIRQ